MYLNYLSFSNYFEMQSHSGAIAFKLKQATYNPTDRSLELLFNNAIDEVSASKVRNYSIKYKNEKIDINDLSIADTNLVILVIDHREVPYNESIMNEQFVIDIKNVFDRSGNKINRIETLSMYQYREFFVNELRTENYTVRPYRYTIPKTMPLYIFTRDDTPEFWENFNYIRNKPLLR